MLHPVPHVRHALNLWVKRAPNLPRTLIVPSERFAHALRRELALDPTTRHLLAGSRFARSIEIARERVLRIEASPKEGLQDVLPLAIEKHLNEPALEKKLSYFPLEQLRRGAGFSEAIAATTDDLSAGNVDLVALGDAAKRAPDDVSRRRTLDLVAILQEFAPPLADQHAVLRRATSHPPSERGSFFAIFPTVPDESEIAFLATIPGLEVAFLTADPPRPEATAAVEALAVRFGGLADEVVPPPPDRKEISILRRFLLSRPEELADPKRPSSAGPDGTVHLELHAGVGDELTATRDWVSEQVRQGVSLERIAVIVPARDPYSGMIHDRLSMLPWAEGDPPLHVAGGLPATDTVAGQRLMGLFDALASGLRVQEFARVLPWLRFENPLGDPGRKHLSSSEANHIVWNCGTLGGSPEARNSGSRWAEGIQRLVDHMGRLAALQNAPDRLQHDVETAKRFLEPTRAALPAILDLVRLNALAAADTPLGRYWNAFTDLWTKRIIAFDPHGTVAALGARIYSLIQIRAEGLDALRVVRDTLKRLRRQVGRFGEPRVFIGTLHDAAGIPFETVRVVGLAEGGVAGSSAEDPMLPDADRRLLGAPVRLASQDPLKDLQALSRLVRHTTRSLVFSAPRQTVDGTVREPSSIFLEVAAALRRPDATTGKLDPDFLRRSALERDYLEPARRAAQDIVKIRPARTSTADVEALVLAHASDDPDPLDGLLRSPPVGSLPKSASGLRTFLECPHRYLFERVLHWEEPDTLPEVHAIDSLTYGNLFHGTVEAFFRQDAKAFYAHERTLDAHLDAARAEADRQLDYLVRFYPLEGEARGRERERLHDDLTHALRHEWARKNVKVVGIELPFGFTTPVAIEGLEAHGFIDRVDLEGGATTVRDYKTGSEKPRKPGEAPNPVVDAQLAFYSLALETLAKELKIPPPTSAGYVYVRRRWTPRRSFEGADFSSLLQAGRGWLGLVKKLAQEGAFLRTPNKSDCDYCPFVPVCGPGATARAAVKMTNVKGAGADFLALKQA